MARGSRKRFAALLIAVMLVAAFPALALAQATGFSTDIYGRFLGNGSAPAPTAGGGSCGTAPATVGTDSFSVTTLGTAPAATCTLTFSRAYGNAPACVAQNQTSAANYVTKTLTTTTTAVISFAAGPTAADKISVICGAY